MHQWSWAELQFSNSPRLSATTVYLHQITGGRATVIPACSIGARRKKKWMHFLIRYSLNDSPGGVGISWHLTIWCNWDSEGHGVIANDYRYILALRQIVISVCVCGRLYLCPSLCNTTQNAQWPRENRRNRNDNPVCNTHQPYKVGETTGPACFKVFWVAPLLRTSFFFLPTTQKGQSLVKSFVAPVFNLAYRWPLSSAIQSFIPAGCGGIQPHFSCSAVIKVTQIRKRSKHNFPVLPTRA